VCCSVLQCVETCCKVLYNVVQCVAVCCSVSSGSVVLARIKCQLSSCVRSLMSGVCVCTLSVATCCGALLCDTVCFCVMHSFVVDKNVSQRFHRYCLQWCGAVCCSMLQ